MTKSFHLPFIIYQLPVDGIAVQLINENLMKTVNLPAGRKGCELKIASEGGQLC